MKITSSCVITIGIKADVAIGYAAETLQRLIKEISGLCLNIKTDANKHTHEIILGDVKNNIIPTEIKKNLYNDGYAYKIFGDKIQIRASSSRGVIYGIYGLLEDKLGCRYFAPECFHLPKLEEINLDDCLYSYSPQFKVRDFCDRSCFDPDYALAQKQNGVYNGLEKKHGGLIEIGGSFCHSLPIIFSPDEYYKEHPEYFALINGKRKKSPSQMCFTNPDLVSIAVNQILKWKRERPDLHVFTISQADGYHFCECENCKKVYKQQNAISGTLMQFINAVAEEVTNEYPDIIIDTLAYLHNRRPPKNIKLHKNVQVRICSIECCQIHPLGECDFLSPLYFENDKSYSPLEFQENEKNWSKLTKNLWAWDYPCQTNHVLLPYPNFNLIQQNIKMHAQNGVSGLFVNASYLAEHSSFSNLRGYLYAKCMWDPDCDIKKHYNEFMDYFYGKAGSAMKEAVAFLFQHLKKHSFHMHFCSNIDYDYYDTEFETTYDTILSKALSLANSPEVLVRIRREHLTIPMLELIKLPASAPLFQEKLDAFFSDAHALGITIFKECEPRISEKLYRHILTEKNWAFDDFETFSKNN